MARDRRRETLCRVPPWRPARLALAALRRVRADTLPFLGVPSFTPARRALDRPMAIACLADRAPCLPWRMWCISSRTNSPACVVAAFPARLSLRARLMVLFSGMGCSFAKKAFERASGLQNPRQPDGLDGRITVTLLRNAPPRGDLARAVARY